MPMLQRIESPPNVLAYRAVGRIEKSDYEEILEPAVDALIADTDEIRFVYVIGDEFDGYSAGATGGHQVRYCSPFQVEPNRRRHEPRLGAARGWHVRLDGPRRGEDLSARRGTGCHRMGGRSNSTA
jgi:hypothetical protein